MRLPSLFTALRPADGVARRRHGSSSGVHEGRNGVRLVICFRGRGRHRDRGAAARCTRRRRAAISDVLGYTIRVASDVWGPLATSARAPLAASGSPTSRGREVGSLCPTLRSAASQNGLPSPGVPDTCPFVSIHGPSPMDFESFRED